MSAARGPISFKVASQGNMLRKHLDFRPFDLRGELFSNTGRSLGRWILTAANNLRGGCGAREDIRCEGDMKRGCKLVYQGK